MGAQIHFFLLQSRIQFSSKEIVFGEVLDLLKSKLYLNGQICGSSWSQVIDAFAVDEKFVLPPF